MFALAIAKCSCEIGFRAGDIRKGRQIIPIRWKGYNPREEKGERRKERGERREREGERDMRAYE